jgi:hypothetical protein
MRANEPLSVNPRRSRRKDESGTSSLTLTQKEDRSFGRRQHTVSGTMARRNGDEEESRDERSSDVRLWEEDVWKQIVIAALGDKPRVVDCAFRREMLRPAHTPYSATRPAVLNWFKRYNDGRPYAEQVKPFNFLLTFFARRQEAVATDDPTHEWDHKLEKAAAGRALREGRREGLAPDIRSQFGKP